MIWGGTDVLIIIEMKCTINVIYWTIPHPRSMEKRSSMKPVPGAKKAGESLLTTLSSVMKSHTILPYPTWDPQHSKSSAPDMQPLTSSRSLIQDHQKQMVLLLKVNSNLYYVTGPKSSSQRHFYHLTSSQEGWVEYNKISWEKRRPNSRDIHYGILL